MKVTEAGHVYELDQLDDTHRAILTFVKRDGDAENKHPGVQNQEVLRALIDRVKYLEAQVPHEVNKAILFHLRMAFVLHESRALERRVAKLTNFEPENIATGPDGHFLLTHT